MDNGDSKQPKHLAYIISRLFLMRAYEGQGCVQQFLGDFRRKIFYKMEFSFEYFFEAAGKVDQNEEYHMKELKKSLEELIK